MKFVNIGSDDEIILSDGKNRAIFDLLDIYCVNENEYAVLLERGDDRVTVLRFEEASSGRKAAFYTVDDDFVFDRIFNMYINDGE